MVQRDNVTEPYLKESNVAYVVAPYEADAQLVYLYRTGQVDVICSEDGDLAAYGMSIEGSECPVSELVNSDTCPRPTTPCHDFRSSKATETAIHIHY